MKKLHVLKALTRNVVLATIAAGAVAGVAHAQANGYPNQPIKLIVPYPPGGGADALARRIGDEMSKELGQSVIVENRPGANTTLATALAAKLPADGYNLLYVASSFAINPSLYKLTYDTEKDFDPVALIAKVPLIILANNDYPVRTVSALLEEAKANPGHVTYASYGAGSPAHLAGELLEEMTSTELLHIPYKGSSPALVDLVGGRVNLAFSSIEPALALVRSNRAQPVAVTTSHRISALPDVPTVAESGLEGFEAMGWNGIVAPAGTPKEIIELLNKTVNHALQTPAVKEAFAVQGVEIDLLSPSSFKQMISSEIHKWGDVVTHSNVKVQ